MLEGRGRLSAAFAAAVLLTAFFASLAMAAETTRDEYKAAVEPICKANTKADEKILKGVRTEVRKGELKPAAAQFAKAATALKKTLAELRAVTQPKADKPELTKWLAYIKAEAELFRSTAQKLQAGDKGGAERMAVLLTREADRANVTVISFEFRYCHGEPSKFT